jgi:ABC-type nitrate/sulfonate/bicarbonate transport system substrate-binding protein
VPRTYHRSRPVRVGFLPLADAAPLIAAKEHGTFARHGVTVELKREVGWATVREKIRLGELDAAQAPAPMLWAMALGLGCPACPVLTAFVLNLNGNALTLARSLGPSAATPEGVREIARLRRGSDLMTLATVFPYSAHFFLIHEWLRRSGLSAKKDVRIVVIPPAQMFRNLVAGTIDGYVAGEPWNSLAVSDGIGWCPLWSSALGTPQVEKVFLVTEKFADGRRAEHAALVAALRESASWCDTPANRPALARMLSAPRYLGLSEKLIAPPLLGIFNAGEGPRPAPDFHIFSRGGANRPSAAKAAQVHASMRASGLLPASADAALASRLFREDLHPAPA